MSSDVIFCTGFDVFEGHNEKNASWEAVKLLPESISFNDKIFKIKTMKVPVTYDGVNEVIPKIWAENPKLVIHCGVSSRARRITLEACSYNLGYCRPDFNQKYLSDSCAELCRLGKGKEILLTNFNIGKIGEELNQVDAVTDCKCDVGDNNTAKSNEIDSKFECSKDVGNYLCGYIYLKSLDFSVDRSLFIHVPEIGKPLTSEQTRDCIVQVIQKCLGQLDDVNLL